MSILDRIMLSLPFIALPIIVVVGVLYVNEKVDYREQCKAKGGVFINAEDRFYCIKKDSVLQ
jgi:hypothetical protein